MHTIRLVPAGLWELPVICNYCGTQIALEWDDIYIQESIGRLFSGLRKIKELRFPNCPGCSRRIEPSEEHRRLIDIRSNRFVDQRSVRVVESGPLKKAKAAGQVDEFGHVSREVEEWG